MASSGIGAKLRQGRLAKKLSINDVSRNTRISPRFLEAIESDDYSSLPGIVFTRNFVRQYALALGIDAEPLLARLPKYDESQAPLPNPPARARRKSSYRRERQIRSLMRSAASLLILGGVGAGIYLHSHHALRIATAQADSGVPKINSTPAATQVVASPEPAARASVSLRQQNGAHAASSAQPAATASVTDPSAPVQVSLTAHARAWIQLIVDGKTTFTGTMNANETRAVSAMEQVHLLTGNAGALTVSLNGKTLDPLGGFGEQREVRLTAEGPQFLTKDPPPAPDQL